MQSVIDFIAERSIGNVEWVRSADVFYEMLPKGVNKGSGFMHLLDVIHGEELFTVGVGDYMNDINLIRDSDLGIAVSNALEEVKKAADKTVCDNNSGAIAEIIEYIEQL